MPTSLSTSTITILVDDREKDSGVIDCLRRFPDIELSIRRLPIGDYLVDNRVLFERKGIEDFCTSIIDGRLFRQAAQLAGQKKRAALIIEGTAADLNHCGVKREAIQGALITVSVFYGIPVLRSRHAEETARLILYTGRQNHVIQTHALPRQGRRPRGKRKQQLYILQGLPGIGPVRAERLLQRFGSLQAIFDATAEELSQVDGICKKGAKVLREVVSETVSMY
ncbi:nuclease [candidate division KSB1 bacterium]|nr:nuclease [candidate division KSB1 bacterium]